MLSVTNIQGNANQNHNETKPHTIRIALIKKVRDNQCWQSCGVKVGGNVNWCRHYGEQYGGSFKKIKIELPYCWITEISLLGIYPEKTII